MGKIVTIGKTMITIALIRIIRINYYYFSDKSNKIKKKKFLVKKCCSICENDPSEFDSFQICQIMP